MSQVDIILKEIFGNDEDSTEEGHDADVPRPSLGREGHITKRRKTDICCSKVGGGMEGGPAASSSALIRDLKSSHTQLLGADGGVIRPLPGLVVVRGALNAQQQLSLAGAIVDSGCLVGETSAPQPPTQPQHQGGAGLGAGAEAWVAGGESARCTGCGAGRSGQVDSQPAQTGSCAEGAGGSSDSGASGGRGVGGGGAGGGGIRRGAPNQAMFFGPLPQWGQQLQQLLPLEQLLPPHLAARAPSFDQAIVNLYRPGEGITDHVDLARFQDGVVGVSVGGPIVMDFRRLPGRRQGAAGGQAEGEVADAEVGYNREAVGRLLQGEGDGEGEGGGACSDGEGDMPGVLPESCPGDGVWWLEDEEATVAAAAEVAARAGAVGPAAGGPYRNGPASGVRKRRRRHHLRVLLQGGDLIGMSGAARYGWTHGIAQGVARERVLLPRGTQAAAVAEEGFVESASLGEEEELGQGQGPVGVLQYVPRGVRLSVTLRRLVPHIVLCEEAGEEGPAGEQVV